MSLLRPFVLCLLLVFSVSSLAQTRGRFALQKNRPYRLSQKETSGISPSEARRRALSRNGGGKVLSMQKSGSGYLVKVIKNGKVRIIRIGGN